MNDALKMFLVLTGTSAVCGLLLAAGNDLTRERIVLQELKFVKGPAVKAVLSGATNDPLSERRVIKTTVGKVTVFIGKKDSAISAVALETSAEGYSGAIHLITGFDPATGTCIGAAVSTASETPGIGSRACTAEFTRRFDGLAPDIPAALRIDGGTIDGIGGATISSKAICKAIASSQQLLTEIRPALTGDGQ